MEDEQFHDRVGLDAACLVGVEVGLGSVLHAFHIPLAGHFLALNQGFFLARSVRALSAQRFWRKVPLSISARVALLKSLSPAGKVLTPILAILGQGFCFSLGVSLLGVNLVGVLVGMCLLSLWTFLQPLAFYYLLFGSKFFESIDALLVRISTAMALGVPSLWEFFALLVVAHLCVACAVGSLAFYCPEPKVDAYKEWLGRYSYRRPKRKMKNIFVAAAYDLSRPYFFLPALMVGCVSYWRSGAEEVVWVLGRSFALGYSFFLLSRALSIWLQSRPKPLFSFSPGARETNR